MEGLGAELLRLTDGTLRAAVPLVLAVLAGLLARRAGVVDFALEGRMLAGAFAAAAAAQLSGSAWAGLVAALGASATLALLQACAPLRTRGEQLAVGMAINVVAAGLTPTLARAWFSDPERLSVLTPEARFGPLGLPGAEAPAAVPMLGPLLRDLISGQRPFFYFTLLAVPAVVLLMERTRFGLRLRAAGEKPLAAAAAGLSVSRLRSEALVLGGMLTGIAGADLALAQYAGFARELTAGRGYLALAALALARWRPGPGLALCLLVAFADVLETRLRGVPLAETITVANETLRVFPYLLLVLLFAVAVGREASPRSPER